MSGIVNKIKEAVHHGDKHSAPEGSHGPHDSRVANAADPRVDSDRDGSHQVGTGTHTSGLTGTSGTHTGAGRVAGHGEYGSSNPFSSDTHSSTTGTHTNPLSSNTHGTAEGVHGPHSSRIANAADPRVDSDRDGSKTVGGTGMGTGMGHTGTHTGSSGLHSTGTGTTGFGSSNTHHAHAGTGVTGMTGTHGAPAGTYGPHGNRVANVADPRVDSDHDGRGAIHSGPGPASNTAGPHKSDMMNKMDPRIDSDLDGSKTVGQNKTYQQ